MATGQRVERPRIDPEVRALEHAVLHELRRDVRPDDEEHRADREVDPSTGERQHRDHGGR